MRVHYEGYSSERRQINEIAMFLLSPFDINSMILFYYCIFMKIKF